MKTAALFGLVWGLLVGLVACQPCLDCPTPPDALRFQVVDILGRDLTTGTWARYNKREVKVAYLDNNREYFTPLVVDTFQPGKTIFELSSASVLAARGVLRYHLYLTEQADTLSTEVFHMKTVCCDYKIYGNLRLNSLPQAGSSTDPFVFLVQK